MARLWDIRRHSRIMNTLAIYGILAIVFLICVLAQSGPRIQSRPKDAASIRWGIPVVETDSAVGAGWFVELDGQRIAELTEPRCQVETPHWLSYVVVPLTDNPKIKEQLFELAFWQEDKLKFRSRKFGVLASGMLMSGCPPCPETHRIICRGLHIHVDAGPSLVERFVGLFRKGIT